MRIGNGSSRRRWREPAAAGEFPTRRDSRSASGSILALEQPKNPLHGLTLSTIVTELADHYGWELLSQHVRIHCFEHEPSVASSLKFLRKTPWAREKVESFYLWHTREAKRRAGGSDPR